MVLKIVAIIGLIGCGLWLIGPPPANEATAAVGVDDAGLSFAFVSTIGAAMVPVLFAYGGWQTSTFVAGEIREPQRNLPRALIIGVAGVVLLYLGVTFVCLKALGVSGLASTNTPASDVMRLALGPNGAAGLLCDGRRRSLFPGRRETKSPDASAHGGDSLTRRYGCGDRALGQIRTDSELRCFSRFYFLWGYRGMYFCLPAKVEEIQE
jgi:hypothetical protein